MQEILISVFILTSILGFIGSGRNSDVVVSLGQPSSFPQMTGIDLHGVERRVPQDLPGEMRLIVAAYLREQQEDVDTWTAELATIRQRVPGITFTELPIIERSGPLFRWWLNNGMRSGIRDEQRRGEVITIYTDVAKFLSAIGQRDNSTITICLLDRDGIVLDKVEGTFNKEKLDELLRSANR